MDGFMDYVPHKNVAKVKKTTHTKFICRNFTYITNEKIAGGDINCERAHKRFITVKNTRNFDYRV